MSTNMNTLHDLPLRAADYIDQNGWTQHQMEDESGAVCLTGALRACSPQPGDWPIARAVTLRKGHTESWNDERGRTAEEVTNWLRTNPITDEDLEDTFGPQWRRVVSLVRRAAVLTEDEAEALSAKMSIERGAARVAVRAAARAATWGVEQNVARSAAFDTAFEDSSDAALYAALGAAKYAAFEDSSNSELYAALRAARYAAWAVVAADLVGEDGLEQHHVDTLLSPWRSVIGDPLEVN